MPSYASSPASQPSLTALKVGPTIIAPTNIPTAYPITGAIGARGVTERAAVTAI